MRNRYVATRIDSLTSLSNNKILYKFVCLARWGIRNASNHLTTSAHISSVQSWWHALYWSVISVRSRVGRTGRGSPTESDFMTTTCASFLRLCACNPVGIVYFFVSNLTELGAPTERGHRWLRIITGCLHTNPTYLAKGTYLCLIIWCWFGIYLWKTFVKRRRDSCEMS